MTAPSAEVLKNMIDNIETKLDDHAKVHEKIIDLIKELQQDLKESNGWKNKFMGAIGVITVIVLPLMSWALYEVVTIDDKIDQALSEAFTIEPYVESNK